MIIIDTDTRLSGIPNEAWEYRLGNRPAIDWVLDQHKEKRLRDATLSTKFGAYRFAGYKTEVIATLSKVVTVAMRTVAIRQEMIEMERSAVATATV